MYYLLLISAVLLAVATLLPLSYSRRWYIRALDFPRLQIFILALFWLIGWAAVDIRWDALTMISTFSVCAVLLYQLYWILPYTRLHNVELQACPVNQIDGLSNISLLSSNVLTNNRNAQALLALVEQYQPDILITLESDHWWQEQLDTLNNYPHRIACPLDNLYGMHIYSRLKLTDSSIDYLVEPDKPSVQMRVWLSEHEFVRLFATHPAPPAPQENSESIERDVELLIIAKSAAQCTEPVIVVGDFNDVAWSATTRLFHEISSLKDPRVGRGFYNTFNARYWFFRWPLDHMFVSEHFRLIELHRLSDIGSDHYPLLAKLALTRSRIPEGSETRTPSEPALLKDIEDSETAEQTNL